MNPLRPWILFAASVTIGIGLVFLAIEAFAASTATSTATAAPAASIFSDLRDLAIPILSLILAWLAKHAKDLIKAKVSNEQTAGVLLRLNDAVLSAVKSVEQSYVTAAKATDEPFSPPGAISLEQRARAKEAAIAMAKSYLGGKGIAEVAKILGLPPEAETSKREVDAMLGDKVEGAVLDLRMTQRAIETGSIPPGFAASTISIPPRAG